MTEWKFHKLSEKSDNFGYILKNSTWQKATKSKVKIQVTSGEIFITSLAEKGLISLISKGLTKWEENKQHYTTGQELYTHNSQENKYK